jgi:hypothetical protein
MLKRIDPTIDDLEERVARLEGGLKMALRLPTDGSRETFERLAVVVVRGATIFAGNPQEQTNEFLRIAAQITESEVRILRQMYEFQGGLSGQAGHSFNQENWLRNVQLQWGQMNKKYPPGDEWMMRKSALVRLQSYGFIEQIRGGGTSERSELGQSAYALLPLGRDFHEYSMPL